MLIKMKTVSEFIALVFQSMPMDESDKLQTAIGLSKGGKSSVEMILMNECFKWSRKAKLILGIQGQCILNENCKNDCGYGDNETACNIGDILIAYDDSSEMNRRHYDNQLANAGLMALQDAIRGWYVLRLCLMMNCDEELTDLEDKLLDKIELYMLHDPSGMSQWPPFMVWRREVEIRHCNNVKSAIRYKRWHCM